MMRLSSAPLMIKWLNHANIETIDSLQYYQMNNTAIIHTLLYNIISIFRSSVKIWIKHKRSKIVAKIKYQNSEGHSIGLNNLFFVFSLSVRLIFQMFGGSAA